MSVMISIDYPAIPAREGEAIKGSLQEKDILGDFGPGQTLMQHLFGKPRPDMTYCNIIEPDWFEPGWQEDGEIAKLTDQGKANLTTAIMAIYDVAGGPITVTCQVPGDKPRHQKEMNISEFESMVMGEGLPFRTLIILDRRLEDREQ